jgi:hypothetical protein
MSEPEDFRPGEGPTSGISVTLTAGTLHAIRARVGKRGVSAYIEEALQRQIEDDSLAAYIAQYTAEQGDFTEAERAAARARLRGETAVGDNPGTAGAAA